jgi:hypothetical protein
VTTDHISPAGAIKPDSPAGQWLQAHGVPPDEFNSYGSRRGNHEVMMRGTFANVRIRNLMLPPDDDGKPRGGRPDPVPAGRASDLHLRCGSELHGSRHAHADLRRRGIRHRLQPRLGSQGARACSA